MSGETHQAAVQTALNRLAELAGKVVGVRQSYTAPPNALNVWPASLCYAGEATERTEARTIRMEQALVCEIHTKRDDLPRAVALLMPYGDSLPALVWADPTLGGTVTKIASVNRTLEWDRNYNGIETLTLVVTVNVIMNRTMGVIT
jgi:hypothetical protein